MTEEQREGEKKRIKEGLRNEKSNKTEDVDTKLGEPYVTDGNTEIDLLTEECKHEMLPIYLSREVRLQGIATDIERFSIPHMNTAGQLKLQNNRFTESFEPDPTVSDIKP